MHCAAPARAVFGLKSQHISFILQMS